MKVKFVLDVSEECKKVINSGAKCVGIATFQNYISITYWTETILFTASSALRSAAFKEFLKSDQIIKVGDYYSEMVGYINLKYLATAFRLPRTEFKYLKDKYIQEPDDEVLINYTGLSENTIKNLATITLAQGTRSRDFLRIFCKMTQTNFKDTVAAELAEDLLEDGVKTIFRHTFDLKKLF